MANIMKTKDKNNEIIGMERFRKGVNHLKNTLEFQILKHFKEMFCNVL